MATLEDLPDVLDPIMISQYLGIAYSKALMLVKKGHFPALRVGNCYKIPKKPFLTWLEQPGLREVL